jgi:hypothetical protein
MTTRPFANEEVPLTAKPGGEKKCRCVKLHIPKANILHSHHVWPTGEGGPNISANLLWLCPTTHNNVHELWRLFKKNKGVVPYDTLNDFSRYTRGVVQRGWAQAVAAGREPTP